MCRRLSPPFFIETSAANGGLQAVSSGLANYERDPGVCMETENQVGIMGFYELRRSERTCPSCPSSSLLHPSRTSMREISLGIEGSPATCSSRLVRGISKSRENRDSSSVSAGEEIMLCHVALILADVHIVELGLVAGLDLDLLGNFSACIDSVALESAEDGSEAAFFCVEAALQGVDHLLMSGRILEVHVERGRIGGAGFGESSLPAPQLHTALVIRVENPSILLASSLAPSTALPAPRIQPPLVDHRAHRKPRWSASWPSLPISARKPGLLSSEPCWP